MSTIALYDHALSSRSQTTNTNPQTIVISARKLAANRANAKKSTQQTSPAHNQATATQTKLALRKTARHTPPFTKSHRKEQSCQHRTAASPTSNQVKVKLGASTSPTPTP